MVSQNDLIAFEESIADEFNKGLIPFPIHLESGNEGSLIDVFKIIKSDDYVFGSWRLHLKALLKGVPPDELRRAIHRGESMALLFPEYRVYGSAIVGGTIPIALGVALSIKRRNGNEYVHCFLGDMSAHTGIFKECLSYAENFSLPIRFIIENNGVSVCSDTEEVCGGELPTSHLIKSYKYKSKFPHAGSGKRIQF